MAYAGPAHRQPCRSRRRHLPLLARTRASAPRNAHPTIRSFPGGRIMTPLLWTLVAIQVAMGAFDTLYHHELTERLAWRTSQRRELQLHSIRNFFYAWLFL